MSLRSFLVILLAIHVGLFFFNIYFTNSPEACAAILWKTAKASPKAAEKLKITATELCKLKIADGVIPEPLGGAHADSSWTSQQIKLAVIKEMNELLEMDTPKLLHHRMLKFRHIGGFIEGEPVDPIKKINMKPKEEPIIQLDDLPALSTIDLEQEVETLKEQILKSKDSSTTEPGAVNVNELIAKLKMEIDQELAKAAEYMGLNEKLNVIRSEIAKQPSDSNLKDKAANLKDAFVQGLANYPNSESLNQKFNTLKKLSKAQKSVLLKKEINDKLRHVMNNENVKSKVAKLEEEISKAGVSKTSDLDGDLKEKIMKMKKEIASELSKALKSKDLELEAVGPKPVYNELKERADELNTEIKERIKEAVNSSDLKRKIDILKVEVEKAGEFPDPETKCKILEMEEEIKSTLAMALDSTDLKEKHEALKEDFDKVFSGTASEGDSLGSNGGLTNNTCESESNAIVSS